MPTAMTFNSLKADMVAYLERGGVGDTVVEDQLPSLINLAERDIATKLKIQGLINAVISSLQTGVSTYLKPDRWRETISMSFGAGVDMDVRTFLYPRAYEYCRTYWPNPSLEEVPLFYSDYDYQHWLISPTPDADYPLEVVYYQQPPLLDESNQTNWLTDYAPQALLYGALVQATPFLKDDDRVQTWASMYGDQLSSLNGQDLQKIIDRTTSRQEA